MPINVIMPPMLLAKAIGISRRLGFMWKLAARLTAMGSSSATVPVLLTNAPIVEVTAISRMKSRNSLFPANLSILLLIILASPVWKIAPPTTNSPIIIITIGFENPDKASSGVRIWNTSSRISAQSATRSERIFPFMKKIAARTRMIRVISIDLKVVRMSV